VIAVGFGPRIASPLATPATPRARLGIIPQGYFSRRVLGAAFLALLVLLTIFTGSGAMADTGLPLSAGFSRTLTGNPGGAVDNYPFIVPPDAPAPKIYVYFSPDYVADCSRAGFTVTVNDSVVGNGQKDPNIPGLLT
jgi:hypothetical protein